MSRSESSSPSITTASVTAIADPQIFNLSGGGAVNSGDVGIIRHEIQMTNNLIENYSSPSRTPTPPSSSVHYKRSVMNPLVPLSASNNSITEKLSNTTTQCANHPTESDQELAQRQARGAHSFEPVSVNQVEPGPQDGTLLVTWHPVLTSAAVTGYAVYADGKKVTDVDSPTGDHALVDIHKLVGLNPKHITVRTKCRESLSGDSYATAIPCNVLRGEINIHILIFLIFKVT